MLQRSLSLKMRVVGFALIGLVPACQPVTDEDAQLRQDVARALADRPVMDRSSPDKTVESWWAMEMWRERFERDTFCGVRLPIIRDLNRAYLDDKHQVLEGELEDGLTRGGECLPSRDIEQTYVRTILRVEMETTTRAVVDARIQNSTAIPENVTLTRGDRAEREFGQPVRYVLSSRGDGWVIENILLGTTPFYFADESGQPSFGGRDPDGYEALDFDPTDDEATYMYVWAIGEY